MILHLVPLHVNVNQDSISWTRLVIAITGVRNMDVVEKKKLTKEMELIAEAVEIIPNFVPLHVNVNPDSMRWIRLVIATIGVLSLDIAEKRRLTRMDSIVEAVQVGNWLLTRKIARDMTKAWE